MNIIKKLIKYNFSSRNGTKIKYIVIHDTGNKKAGSTAYNHFLYFNGGNRQASAHYFVDDKEIIQLVEDEKSSWHVGDGKGKYGVTNSNSIGIEICVNSDGNYAKAVQDTIELTKYLMQRHNIPLENVIRHYDASRKNCPASMSANNWADWFKFKENLKQAIQPKQPTAPVQQPSNIVKVNYKGKQINLDGFMKDDINYVQIRQVLEALGFKVGWDNVAKAVLVYDK